MKSAGWSAAGRKEERKEGGDGPTEGQARSEKEKRRGGGEDSERKDVRKNTHTFDKKYKTMQIQVSKMHKIAFP